MSLNQNLQNSAPTSNTLPRPDESFVIELSSDFNKETSAEGTEELFFNTGTGISTIKRHFESNHKSEYHQLLQLSPPRAVEYYGVRDEKKIKRLNGRKILSMTADNASNMDACGEHLASMLEYHYDNNAFCRLRCAAHILNLAVVNGLSMIDESTKKARNFSSHIRRSQPCLEELKKIFAMKNQPVLMPELDCETRWNSLYLMLSKLYKIKDMTDILVVSMPQLKQQYMTIQDWNNIQIVITLLEPIYEATKLLSSSTHPTIGDVRTVFFVIVTHLTEAKREINSTKSRISEKILEKLDKYWNELQSSLPEAVLLDPSSKFSTFYSSYERNYVRQIINKTYKNYAPSDNGTTNQIPCLSQFSSARDYFRNQLKRTYDDMSVSCNVLDEYLNMPDENVDTLAFWKSKSSNIKWVPLVKMARDYLVAQATSVPSEQAFSLAKHTINAVRNRLEDEK
ncbi:3578_t:CDS:2, partial [Ambispora leptoticha]